MLICHCNGVRRRAICEAVLAGARTVDEVASACGAGAACGGCRESVAEVIDGRDGLGGIEPSPTSGHRERIRDRIRLAG